MKKCPKCGSPHGDNFQFCENCGSYLGSKSFFSNMTDYLRGLARNTQSYAPNEASSSSVSQQKGSDLHCGNLIDSNETVQATIGVSYLQGLMSGVGFKNGAAVLTDKRLYYFGRSFSNVGKGMNTATEEGIISIGDITFTRFVHGSPLWHLILAIAFTLPGVMLFTRSFGSTDDIVGVFGMVGLLFALLGMPFFVTYFVGRSTVLEISFPGGKYCFDARWHSVSNMREFQRQIHLVKDSLKASRCSENNREGPHDE